MRDDRRLLLKIRVPARMIAVVVRIDDEPHWLVCYALKRGLNLVGQRRVLIVDDNDPVFAHGGANVSACALEHIHIPGYLCDLNLDFAEILILGGCPAEREEHTGNDQQEFAHEIRAANELKTRILGNYRFDYREKPVRCEGFSWFDRIITPSHMQSECDPQLWSEVENLMRQRLESEPTNLAPESGD